MAKAAWNIISGLFLSTPSVRRATPIQTPHRQKKTIPIHALREEGDRGCPETVARGIVISIHALREEGDPITTNKGIALIGISIHALREEGDGTAENELDTSKLFLSTPSARRATLGRNARLRLGGYFYPRPPRGGRPISSDRPSRQVQNFYPRPPRGGRRSAASPGRPCCPISIHALRGEGDAVVRLSIPCDVLFLSTPSARRATRPISGGAATSRNFYPRPP